MPTFKERVEIGPHVLYLGDCREILPTLTADLCVTSPPYASQRDYGGDLEPWSDVVPSALASMRLSESGQVLVNLGLVHADGEVVTYWDALIASMRAALFRLFGWYVWDQGDGLPGDWNGRFAPSHEFIFHFNRHPRRPRKMLQTKTKGRIISGTGLRRADGSTNEQISGFGDHVQGEKIPDSVVRIYREMKRNIDHPAVFPLALPLFLIEAYSESIDTILDPFMGSGTTGVACAKLGRKFIGVEIHEPYFRIACRRIADAVNGGVQPELF